MAGLLTPQSQQQAVPADPQAGGNAGGADTLNDPILKQIEQGIEEKIPPEMKQAYLAIVVSGMQIMFSKETSDLIDKTLDMPGDMVANISQGIAKLLGLIYNESTRGGGQGMEIRMAVPAAITLLCQAMDYAEHTKGMQVTPEIAANATKQATMATLKMFGIGEDKVNKAIAAGQQQQGAAPPDQQAMTGA